MRILTSLASVIPEIRENQIPREFLNYHIEYARFKRLTILFNSYQQAALQPGKLSVNTKSYVRTLTGPADRFLLTKEILEFCGDLPIYKTDIFFAENVQNNDTASE